MTLRSGEGADVCREALADCVEESDRIIRMLNTLMDISEAESGAMALDLREIKVCEVIDEVAELYGYVAEQKEVTLETSCAQNLSLLADPVRIRQAIGNLVDNTPPGVEGWRWRLGRNAIGF